ncbi:hypothetical protein [Mycobacterium paraterrae]|uniref:Secreted protein n=1 Tax=Mycobacterium paraterrae TaxID=577492 RepID=A0ABY3VW51_9MYCO|nr:hypothetical protein [Mycobacterium paraterrae]UMB71782.1 hypothetical protein MKK62_11470 [Mycobacterium paraterrae]
MSSWVWAFVAVAVIIAIPGSIVALGIARNHSTTRRLRQHYGPEYDRLVAEAGSEKAANRELTTREKRREGLDIVPLSPAAIANFTNGWQEVQASFVDNPASAVQAADRLVTEVMRERGYPVDDFDRRAADVSVDHPDIVDSYRAAHDVNSAGHDKVSTEQQRDAFVHYRTLFEKLLAGAQDDTTPKEASA